MSATTSATTGRRYGLKLFPKVPSGITVQSAPIQRARTFSPCSRNWPCGPTYL